MDQKEEKEHLLQDSDREDTSHLKSDDELHLKPTDNKDVDSDTGTWSWKRWLILLLFSFTTMLSAMLFEAYSPISQMAIRYYSVDSDTIDWFGNSYFLAYVVLALPASFLLEYYGLRITMIFVSLMNAGACCFRMGALVPKGFVFSGAGQVLAALGYCFILEAPTKLSVEWFPPTERALATSVGAAINIFGVAMGFLLDTQIVPESKDMVLLGKGFETLYIVMLVASLVLLLAVIVLFSESAAQRGSMRKEDGIRTELTSIGVSLKALMTNWKFHLLMQSYAIYFALFNSFFLLLEKVVRSKYHQGYEKNIGWMGFASITVSIPAAAIYGLILDRFKNYRFLAALLNSMSLFLMIAFLLVLNYTSSFVALSIIYITFGAFGIPFFATGLEHAAVMTSPVPEAISSAVMLILGNLYAFITILTIGKGVNSGFVISSLYVRIALYVISTLLAFFTKVDVKDD